MINLKVGGFTKFRVVNDDDLKVFHEALEGFTGSSFEPLIVSTQVVAGTNYKFICNAQMVTNPPIDYTAEIMIFKPLEGKAVMTQLTELNV